MVWTNLHKNIQTIMIPTSLKSIEIIYILQAKRRHYYRKSSSLTTIYYNEIKVTEQEVKYLSN